MRVVGLYALLLVVESSAWSGRRGVNYADWWPKWAQDPVEDWTSRDASGMPKWQRKLCKKIGRVPGLNDYCKSGNSDWDMHSHGSRAELQQKLHTEKDKSKRLTRELEKEKVHKQQKEMQLEKEMRQKDRQHREKQRQLEEKMRQKQIRNQGLEQQFQDEKLQAKQLKLKLDAKARELDKERLDRRETEKQLWKDKGQMRHLKAKLEAKVRELEVEVANFKSSLAAEGKGASGQHKDQLELQVEDERRRANIATAELKSIQEKLLHLQQSSHLQQCPESLLLQNMSEIASQIDKEKKYTKAIEDALLACQTERDDPTTFSLSKIVATLAVWIAIAWSVWSFRVREQLHVARASSLVVSERLNVTKAELTAKLSDLSVAEAEINSELGGMIKKGQAAPNLGTDFTFHIFDEMKDQEKLRSIKIQCSGVYHRDVSVEIIFNGCVVTISRKPSEGVDGVEWSQRFQFRPSEGLFEMKEDQAALEAGYLTLVFRATDYQSRMFRFPKHFDMSSADVDGTYDFPQDSAGGLKMPSVHGNGTERSNGRGVGTAPWRLEMTMAEVMGQTSGADTSGSPADTDDYDATRRAIALAATLQGSSSSGSSWLVPLQVPTTTLAHLPADIPAAEVDSAKDQEITGGAATPLLSAAPPSQKDGDAASSQVNSEDFERVQECNVLSEESEDASF